MELFLFALMVVSLLTGLTTEAIKSVFQEHNIKYSSNTLAGITSVILSFVLSIMYVIATATAITPVFAVMVIALIFMSWLGAMVGYDKVTQTIQQIITAKEV